MGETSRRDFIKAGLLGAGSVSLAFLALSRSCRRVIHEPLPELMGKLLPVADETTGLPLLRLPEGFRYRTLAWAGQPMGDGRPSPGNADGMGVVDQQESRITLVRNHELAGSAGPMGAAERSYDVTGGGTTTLVFDLESEVLAESWVSLSGTAVNCAGGVTPWGSWLSCEEVVYSPGLNHLPVPTRQYFWRLGNAKKEHGFVFEVPARGLARPEPITAMGQFYHEAATVDPRSGSVYLTEDNAPRAGFYRYIPNSPGQLGAGGQLQMMRAGAARDMRDRLVLREWLPVLWVPIDQPERGFTRGNRDGNGVVSQGLAAGGSAFSALEGCTCHHGRIFFTSKLGGQANAGCVFEYDPEQELVRLIYESPGHELLSGPDNITMSPRGSLVICEDRMTRFRVAQILAGLTADGQLFRFCQINHELDYNYLDHDLGRTVRESEWAGVTFSPDGQWLFCNLYNPGVTLAISGPWQDGLI